MFRVRLTTLLLAICTAFQITAPATARAVAEGDTCIPGKGISGGSNCKVERLWSGSGYPGAATGTTLFADTATAKSCNASSRSYFYTADVRDSTGVTTRTRLYLARWMMRLPSDVTVDVTFGTTTIVSTSVYYGFGVGGGSTTETSHSNTYHVTTQGGGTTIGSQAKVHEILVWEDWSYYHVQQICINASGRVTDVIASGLKPSGKSPIHKYEMHERASSGHNVKLVSSPPSFPQCTVKGDGATHQNVSSAASSETKIAMTRQLGISADIGPAFRLEAQSARENSITLTFHNNSNIEFGKRVFCVLPRSLGSFSDLAWSGNNDGVNSLSKMIPGLYISVSTRCIKNDLTVNPCPKS